MRYIYLDESGDLGFDFGKHETTRYFVITFLLVDKKRPIEKIIKNIFSGFTKAEVKRHNGILHAYKETPTTIKRVLAKLVERDIKVLSIFLNKENVYTRLQDMKHVLYNYVTNILLDRICRKNIIPTDEPIILVASKRETNKFLNDNFTDYLASQLKQAHGLELKIEIKTPFENKCLQAVDIICWAIFKKQERGDATYYDIIKPKIFEESLLFP
jgi:hypothetical protein